MAPGLAQQMVTGDSAIACFVTASGLSYFILVSGRKKDKAKESWL